MNCWPLQACTNLQSAGAPCLGQVALLAGALLLGRSIPHCMMTPALPECAATSHATSTLLVLVNPKQWSWSRVHQSPCLTCLQPTAALPGTLFVLVKDITLKQRLLEACQSKGCTREEVEGLIEQLVTASSVEGDRRPAQSPRAVGKWRLRWSAQVCWSWDASRFVTSSGRSLP